MTVFLEATRAHILSWDPLWTATLALAIGALLGLAHFRALELNARLFAEGAALKGGVLQGARFALLLIVLAGLAQLGASPLIAGALGLLAARRFIVRRWGLA